MAELARARARRGLRAPPRGRPRRRSWRGSCCAPTSSSGALRTASQRLADALEPAVGGDRARRGRGRRAPRRLRAARRGDAARHAARPRRPRRPHACGACRSGSCPRSRRCWPPRASARGCSPRWSRPPRCGAATCVKTALLRAVSHDLRSPLTAIVTAADGDRVADGQRRRARRAGRGHHERVAAALAAGRPAPRPVAARGRRRRAASATGSPLDEVIRSAIDSLDRPPQTFALALDRDLPLLARRRRAARARAAPTCSTTPRATRAGTRCRCGRAPSAGACSCESSTAARACRRPSASASSSPSIARAPRRPGTAARAWGWPSPAA